MKVGLREDLDRFRDVGEEERQDLSEFIKRGELQSSNSEEIKIPIKVIDLPEFEYDQYSAGGVASGDADVGDPVPVDEEETEGEGEEGEPGEEEGEHGHYEMDAEEFAEELDERLGLDLDPKGKKVKEITEGAMVEKVRSGPDATVDFEELFKKGLKRELALYFDEEYLEEVLKVEGMGVEKTFEWARNENIPVSKAWISQACSNIPISERDKYSDIDEIEKEYRQAPKSKDLQSISLRREDKRHKHPEITKEYEKNAVIVFIRDVSGSMGENKRELVERVFTPLDWYLTGKYDNAEFRYIAHDFEANEVQRNKFFGMQSGGGTKISSAYKLTKEILDEEYPWSEWNRYVFAAGDGENHKKDTENNVIPLVEEIEANLHAYIEVGSDTTWMAEHADIVEGEIGDRDNVAVSYVNDREEVMPAIEEILSTESDSE